MHGNSTFSKNNQMGNGLYLGLKLIQVTGKSLSEALFFCRTCCVEKLIWLSETIFVYNIFSPGLSLEFSYTELEIKWTTSGHIVG